MVIARTIRIGPRRPAQLGCVYRSLEGLCLCMEANKKTQKKSAQTLCRLINPNLRRVIHIYIYKGLYRGTTTGVIKGDTRSLDNGSSDGHEWG